MNNNGIFRSGHLLVDYVLSPFFISCVEGTKFYDHNQLDSFHFISFKNAAKMFLNDHNSAFLQPNRNRTTADALIERSI